MSRAWTIRRATTADDAARAALASVGALDGAAADARPADETVLLASDAAGTPAGCVAVRRRVGLDRPRYWYHVGCLVLAAPELGVFHRQRTLLLGNDHTGATELAGFRCAAALDDAARRDVLATLARAALAEAAADAAATVIVELPGARDAAGRSPFWHGLGRHFYAGDPAVAAARFGPAWRTHLAALLPRQTLLVSFLDEAAEAALGDVAADARVLADALAAAGFRRGDHVTIDDGAAVYEARAG